MAPASKPEATTPAKPAGPEVRERVVKRHVAVCAWGDTCAEKFNDRKDAALRASEALRNGNAAAIGAAAGTHTGSATCAQTIARVSGR